MRLRSFARDLKLLLPEMQQLIQTLVSGLALLASAVALWHQMKQ